MGRDIGTNVYSNNFEPQVMGLLDARTRVDTKADLTKTATWTSADGNTYVPVGIRVSVTDDTTNGNNGVYMLMGEEYTIASNWMQINSSSGGGSTELVMVDLSTVNTIPGTYTPDRYLMGEFIKIQDALSIDTPFFVYQFNAEFGQFQTSAIADGSISLQLSILYRDEIWLINFDGGNYTVAKADMGGSSVSSNVKILTTPDLLNASRTSTINLSAADIAIIKGLSVGKDILVYNGVVGAANTYTPLTIMNAGSGSLQLYNITFAQASALYTFSISTTNKVTYTVSILKKVEGSGGSSETAYLTTLDLWGTISSDPLDQSDYDEIVNIFNKWKAGIPIVVSMRDYYNGILNISTNRGDITEKSTISFSITRDDKIEIWKVLMKVGSYWERVYKKLPTEISLYDIVAKNATDLITSEGEYLYDSIMMLDSIVSSGTGESIYASYFDSLSGHYPISIRDTFPSFVVNYSGREFQIDYQINRDNTITYSVTDITKYDLSIDVKTYSPQGIAPKIYFRIREKVPNGRIHFVRKKRMRYFDRNDNVFHSLCYAVMKADCHHDGGVDVSTLSPNTWYEYPITGVDLISSYPPGSSVNGKVRTHGVIRFKGATYAKSFEFKNAPFTQTQTTLHAGLQYNVLSGKKSPLFKERGEVVPIDVRLILLSTSNYNAGYEYSYVVQ